MPFSHLTHDRTATMSSSIVIKNIQLNIHCGVTDAERSQPQPIVVDLTFQCQNEAAFQSDDLHDTVDYAAITQCIRDSAERQNYGLLEKLTEDLCQALFQQFPLTHVKIWVRKINAPIQDFSGSVGIEVNRSREDCLQTTHGHPSRFLIDQLPRLPQGKALDLATGQGRHACFLATQGFSVHGIDRNREALAFIDAESQAHALPITTEYMDLELDDQSPPHLGTEVYDVILVFFYLYRPIFSQLIQALKPGGVILYETFLLENHLSRQHPRRKEFCLETNELLALLPNFHILHYDEGDHEGPTHLDRAFTARALARKP